MSFIALLRREPRALAFGLLHTFAEMRTILWCSVAALLAATAAGVFALKPDAVPRPGT